MSDNFLGGFGGLMKGLSGFMPQDDPAVKLMTAQNEVSDLKAQESAIYAEIGKLAFGREPDAFPAQTDKLRLIRANLAGAEANLKSLTEEKREAEQAEKEATDQLRCPGCGHQNPDGVKFCQECGSKLGAGHAVCPACGEANPPGVRFCGNCGSAIK